VIVDANEATARPCPCGSRGCLEAHASASAIARDYETRRRRPRRRQICDRAASASEDDSEEELKLRCGCEDVFALAETGDPVARSVVDDAARAVAVASVNLLRVLNPDVVVIAGGVASAGAPFLEAVRTHAKSLAWTCLPFDEKRSIVLAAAGPHTGCIGAASYARVRHRDNRRLDERTPAPSPFSSSSPPRVDERGSACFSSSSSDSCFWRRNSSSSCDGRARSLCVLS